MQFEAELYMTTKHPRRSRAIGRREFIRSGTLAGLGVGLATLTGSASAAYLLVVTFVGLALGRYTVGRLSVAVGDLGIALLCALGAGLVGAGLLLLASRHIARDEATRFERAQAAGER